MLHAYLNNIKRSLQAASLLQAVRFAYTNISAVRAGLITRPMGYFSDLKRIKGLIIHSRMKKSGSTHVGMGENWPQNRLVTGLEPYRVSVTILLPPFHYQSKT